MSRRPASRRSPRPTCCPGRPTTGASCRGRWPSLEDRRPVELHHGRHRPAAAGQRQLRRGDIVLYGLDARSPARRGRSWPTRRRRAASACGTRMPAPRNVTTALASPANYVTITFDAVAGQPYHLWMRGRAEGNSDRTTPSSSSSRLDDLQRHAHVPDRDDLGRRIQPRGLQRLRPGRLGLAGQRLGRRRPRPRDRTSTRPAPRRSAIQNREDGLSIDQILLSPPVPEHRPRGAEERPDHLPGSTGSRRAAAATAASAATVRHRAGAVRRGCHRGWHGLAGGP